MSEGNNSEFETEVYSHDLLSQEYKTFTVHFAGRGPQKVQCAVVDGLVVMEGDIIIGKADEGIEPEEKNGDVEFLFVREVGKHWPNGIVPYVIDSALPQPERVHQAIQEWNTRTVIQLIPRTTQRNYVVFQPGDGCSSALGMQGGAQTILLGGRCSRGNAIHEIGHAIGMLHEQNAPDREEYVEIRWENIEEKAKPNFRRATWQQAGRIGPYDYGSIMHYGTHFFSKNGLPTIIPKINVEIGQRNGLSQLDIQGVNALYSGAGDEGTLEAHVIDAATLNVADFSGRGVELRGEART